MATAKPKRKPRKKIVKPRVVKKEEDFEGASRKFPCEFCGKDFSKASEKRTHWKKEHVNETKAAISKLNTQLEKKNQEKDNEINRLKILLKNKYPQYPDINVIDLL